MKKGKLFIKSLLFTSILCFTLISCATTNQEESKSEVISGFEEEMPAEEEVIIVEPTAEELFLEKLSGISIKFTNTPAKIKKGKEFKSAFDVMVTNADGEPVSDFELSFKYPAGKSGSQLVFETTTITSNSDGIASFMPSNTSFAANAKITVLPAYDETLSITETDLAPYTTQADFLIESDITTRGAIMFVFEFTESGKPSKNSYDILSALRKKGVYQIGNAPISDTEYINASKTKIYKENYEYVGSEIGYLIGGTVKFVCPVEKIEDEYKATLCADIYGIDMKTGQVIYENKHEASATGANWNTAVTNCKNNLTKIVADAIMFGL